ncbi:hypothetical protein PFISCL1PPCAC_26619, partial [Pristionchus fissidentatus]
MARSLGVFVLLATSIYVVAALPPTCDFDVLQRCQDTFNDALGIVEPKPWQDSNSYRTKIETIYEKTGTEGVRKVCKFFRQFKECLGPCYQQTVQIPFLVQNAGVAPAEATTYMATFNSMHYTCGAGFGTYMSNPTCFINTWKNSRVNLESVRDSFESLANLNPAAACSMANNVLTQFERAFAAATPTGCGPDSKDTQFWGCEYARTGIFTAYPQCTLSCA